MNLSKIFIERPVATTLLMWALFITGIMCYRLLPVASLPSIDYPIIRILTMYPGASTDIVNNSITSPLEKELGKLSGLQNISSTSSSGVSIIVLKFNLDTDLGVAEQEVQTAITTTQNLLPIDLPTPPVYNKINPADAPILTLAISSDTLPLSQVNTLIDTRLNQKLSQISGVGLVSIAGGQKAAIRIEVNTDKLASLGLNLSNIRDAISSANVNAPKGSFDGPTKIFQLDSNDQMQHLEDYKELIIKKNNDNVIRLKDVSIIKNGVENEFLTAWKDKKEALLVNIQKQPGANVIEVVDKIKNMLPELKETLPASVDIEILTDRTKSIRSSVDDIEHELILSITLVILITFLFLRKFTATIIPSITVPLSLIGTFIVMYFLGYTLNNLTLMALTVATGFVVDDAIVMLENITRYIEEGESPFNAAIKGAGQIGFTLISLTISLIAVLIPLLFMGDIVGRLFKEFAVTLSIAILISLVISLTLTPMMCAKLLKVENPESQNNDFFGRIINKLIKYYSKALRWSLNRKPLMIIIFLLTLIIQIGLYFIIPKGFFPAQDIGLIQGITIADQNISFHSMSEKTQQVIDKILEDQDVKSVSASIGVDHENHTLNSGKITINLKDTKRAHASNIIERLEKELDGISGIKLYMQITQDLTIEDKVTTAAYQFSIKSLEESNLIKYGHLIYNAILSIPQIKDVNSDLQDKGMQIYLNINRDKVSQSGISISQINNALYDAFGQRQISTIYTQSNQYRVVLVANYPKEQGIESIKNLYIINKNGNKVLLSELVTIEHKATMLSINKSAQFPMATISFNLNKNTSLNDAIKTINKTIQTLNIPDSIYIDFEGTASAFSNSLSSTLWLLLAAIITMYIVLGILYESYIHPITILSTLPSAAVGALLALYLSNTDLGLISIIGIILLIGIVKKNAIMMIDFAIEEERKHNINSEEAIYKACLLRFRPILMTTLAALFAAIPLLFATGSSAELRKPMGLVMVGGLTVSQLLTLFTTPVIYIYFDKLTKK